MKPFAKLCALALLTLTAACGVQPTGGAVPAGPAPTLPTPGAESGTLILYFVLDGHPAAVVRSVGGPVSVNTALSILLRGPDPDDRIRGYSTELPPPGPGLIGSDPSSDRMVISVPFAVTTLSSTAVNQLVCTAAIAAKQARPPSYYGTDVTVIGPDGQIASRGCLS
ncbi:hypothetical protein [Amycolatopsis sp. NPDC059021]|uniref:hypothetical protein n=1 Tax=Amycolatopsis sp. NPDC059021 TaxID=3346704 RepID=UPI00366BD75A